MELYYGTMTFQPFLLCHFPTSQKPSGFLDHHPSNIQHRLLPATQRAKQSIVQVLSVGVQAAWQGLCLRVHGPHGLHDCCLLSDRALHSKPFLMVCQLLLAFFTQFPLLEGSGKDSPETVPDCRNRSWPEKCLKTISFCLRTICFFLKSVWEFGPEN